MSTINRKELTMYRECFKENTTEYRILTGLLCCLEETDEEEKDECEHEFAICYEGVRSCGKCGLTVKECVDNPDKSYVKCCTVPDYNCFPENMYPINRASIKDSEYEKVGLHLPKQSEVKDKIDEILLTVPKKTLNDIEDGFLSRFFTQRFIGILREQKEETGEYIIGCGLDDWKTNPSSS